MATFAFAAASEAPASTKQTNRSSIPPPSPYKKQRTESATTNGEVFINNVEFKIPNKKGNEKTSVRDTVACYFARMKQIDKTMAILPLSDDTLPTILSSVSLPTEEECYSTYFTIPKINRRHTSVHLTIQSTIRFNDVKFNPFIKGELDKSKIWIIPHSIQSHNVTNVGWIYNHTPDQFSKSALKTKINKLLPSDLHEKYQLQVKIVPYFLCKKTHTRAFVMEMDKTENALHQTRIFEILNASSEVPLIPFNSGLDQNNKMKNFFFKNNEILSTYTSLCVHYLFGIDEVLISNDGELRMSLRQFFEHNDNKGNRLFFDVTQFNKYKVTFQCKRSQEEHCSEELEKFLNEFVPNRLTPESQALIMSKENPPTLVGSKEIPQSINVFFKSSAENPIDLTTDAPQSFTSPPRSSRSTYLKAAAKAASSLSQSVSPSASQTSKEPATTFASTISDSQYNKLSARIDKMLEINAVKNASTISDQKEVNEKVNTFSSQLEKFSTDMSELNTKINNNTKQMGKVLEQHGQMNNKIDLATSQISKLVDQFQIIIRCLPEDIRINIQNSNKEMEGVETHQE